VGQVAARLVPAVRMTYFWTWFNVLTMGIDDASMGGEASDETSDETGGGLEREIARLRDEPARSLAALTVRGRMTMVVPLPQLWLHLLLA
jgi:hypothetical protein